ncbi:MAG: hypothetical protein J3R72DRAFT_484651 [Linnemannia gamsii]|nr:MAG: hypothetical protein J3R72DRAFT_484651 [Linnemannia gamsii]
MGFDVDTSHFTYAQYGKELYRRGVSEQNWFVEHWHLATVGITDYRTDWDNEEVFNESAYEQDSDDEDTEFDSEEEDEEEEKEGEFGDKKG